MKLPEADFRPKRRAGHVPSGSHRKIPIIRILLILVAAVAVYQKFDAFFPKLHAWLKPAHPSQGVKAEFTPSGNSRWSFSRDSTHATLNCSHLDEADYCRYLEQQRQGLCGQVRALLEKARWFGALKAPVLSRIEVRLSKTESSESGILAGLQGHDVAGKFRYERANGDPAFPWCDSTRGCLSPPSPRFPLTQGKIEDARSGDTISLLSSRTSSVFPVLSGMVIGLDSLSPENHRVLLYHGRELYTLYEGLRRVAPDLKSGTRVEPLESIGTIGAIAQADSLALPDTSTYPYQMGFRVEQAGMILDPAEFLAMGEQASRGR